MWKPGLVEEYRKLENTVICICGPIQSSAKRWAPGFVNAAGKLRQKW